VRAGTAHIGRRVGIAPTLALLTATLLVATAARAGTVQVLVSDREGKPAADVVVLVEPERPVLAKAAPTPVLIGQKDSRFVPFLTVVPQGSTVRFVNSDDYDHHVRSVPSGPLAASAPVSSFEFRLAAAAEPASPGSRRQSSAAGSQAASVAEVVLPNPGLIGLGCHIHASMRGQIVVSATPWFAITDAEGYATLNGVPEGAAVVRLWHSNELQAQAPIAIVSKATLVRAEAALNFTPRRRRR
jgi:plastocyanin